MVMVVCVCVCVCVAGGVLAKRIHFFREALDDLREVEDMEVCINKIPHESMVDRWRISSNKNKISALYVLFS